jgi:hypothetical protein
MLDDKAKRIVDSTFKREVLIQCYDALEGRGFTRFRKDGVDRLIRDQFYCWVGLNTAVHKDNIEINPFVGIHVTTLEKMWTSLKRGKYPGKYDRSVATYAVHLGELVPDEAAFQFYLKTDLKSEGERLADIYIKFGLIFAEEISTYETLLPMLYKRVDMLGGYPERFACCLFLMNRYEEARVFSEDILLREPDYFEGFANPFLKLFEQKL